MLVAGTSRRGAGQLSGRDPYHRLVNFEAPAKTEVSEGDLVEVDLVAATPHSLLGELAGSERRTAVKPAVEQADEWVRIGGVPS